MNLNAYPNPFSSQLTLEYELTERSEVTVKIYNESGVLMDILDHGKKPAGTHSVVYNANSLNDGVYFVSFEQKNTGSGIVKKVICIK